MKGMSVMVFGTQRRRPCGRFPAGPSMWFCLAFLVCLAASAYAAPPDLQTPAPVVYLADNLDEQDKLGWCIDTVGRGFGERLHAHSCKPRGGDVPVRLRPGRAADRLGDLQGQVRDAAGAGGRGRNLRSAGLCRQFGRTGLRLRRQSDGVPARRGPHPLSGGGCGEQEGGTLHVARSRARALRRDRRRPETVAHQRRVHSRSQIPFALSVAKRSRRAPHGVSRTTLEAGARRAGLAVRHGSAT